MPLILDIAYHKAKEDLNEMGYSSKKLLLAGDGSFCNKICMGMQLEKTSLVARCRKDACQFS